MFVIDYRYFYDALENCKSSYLLPEILYQISDLKQLYGLDRNVAFFTNIGISQVSDININKFYEKLYKIFNNEPLKIFTAKHGCNTFDYLLNLMISFQNKVEYFMIIIYQDNNIHFDPKIKSIYDKLSVSKELCKPLNKTRYGIYFTGGYSIYLISKYNKSNIKIIDTSFIFEFTNGFNPNKNSLGYNYLLSNINLSMIDYIKANANGSFQGDVIENDFLSKLDIPYFSVKGYVGDSLTNSGVENCFIFDKIVNHNVIPKTYNCDVPLSSNILIDDIILDNKYVIFLSLFKSLFGMCSYTIFKIRR